MSLVNEKLRTRDRLRESVTAFLIAQKQGAYASANVIYVKVFGFFSSSVCFMLFYMRFVDFLGLEIPSLVTVRITVGRPSH